jgi:hypothetical protein
MNKPDLPGNARAIPSFDDPGQVIAGGRMRGRESFLVSTNGLRIATVASIAKKRLPTPYLRAPKMKQTRRLREPGLTFWRGYLGS